MTDELADFMMTRPPTAARPLLGLTVLVVEDSRFACEAMRLLCLRSGARIRRADCLRSAARHLQVYRPTVVIADLGLPDGSGTDLIAQLATLEPRVSVILGTSGDPAGRAASMAAGADGFLEKPLQSLALFQETVLAHLPASARPAGLRVLPDDSVTPDRMALRDDLVHAAEVLERRSDATSLEYIARFLAGIGRSAADEPLQDAARAVAVVGTVSGDMAGPLTLLTRMVHDRLAKGATF